MYREGFSADSQLKKEWKDTLGDYQPTREEYTEYLSSQDYLNKALGNVKQRMRILAGLFDESKMEVYLTGKGNYRDRVASLQAYKGNRDSTHKPKYYKEIREYLINTWHANVVDGMEADDMVSILQYAATDKSTIIVSIDKDLLNTPGHHFNQNTGEYSYVTLPMANLAFWKQVATGDRTDNIPGLKGVGEVTAQRWAEACNNNALELEAYVRNEYDKRFGPAAQEVLHENATLLWMQRMAGVNYDGSLIEDYPYKEWDYGNEEGHQEGGGQESSAQESREQEAA